MSRAISLGTLAYISAAELYTAISSLETKDVEKALKLRLDQKDKETKSLSRLLLLLPQILVEYLKLIDEASNRSLSTESSVRWTIDALLLNAHSIAAKRTPSARPINFQQRARIHMGRCDRRENRATVQPMYGGK